MSLGIFTCYTRHCPISCMVFCMYICRLLGPTLVVNLSSVGYTKQNLTPINHVYLTCQPIVGSTHMVTPEMFLAQLKQMKTPTGGGI